MDYLLKSSAIIFIFYTCYKLFLQRDTFFESNRWFLLLGLIIASCIPLIVIPIYIEYTPVQISEFAVINTNATTTPIQEQTFNYIQLLTWIYLSGLVFFIGKLTIELLSLKRILKTGHIQTIGNFKLIETKEQIAPFSFFNYIVYNPNQFNETELQHVINHEKAHTQQIHSLDTIIAQIFCVLLWFNPFAWLYKRALQQNLEFIADQKAQYVSPCEKSYQTVLLKASVKNHQLVFTNNFYTSLIKKRIIMLHKSKSKKLNQLKLIVVLPLIALFIMSFNTKDVYIEVTAKENNKLEQLTKGDEIIEIIITKSTSDADLKNIKKELQSKDIIFNYSNLKRNADGEIIAIKTEFKNDSSTTNYNIAGDESIKPFRFTSSKDSFNVGTLDSNTFVYRTNDGGKVNVQSSGGNREVIVIDEEDENGSSTVDVRVLRNKDTAYYFKNKNKLTWTSDDTDSNVFISESDEPIFIINGKKVEKSLFEDVDSDDIQSIFVLKEENAFKKYGNEGKNGVIVMTKKGSKNLFSESDDTVIMKSNNANSFSEFTFKSGEGEPLYIIDGKVIGKDEVTDINTNIIQNIEVLKDKSAIKLYGKEGGNGVILINTKKNIGNSISRVVTGIYSEDNERIDVLTKNASKTDLNKLKEDLKAKGIEAKFSRVKRNKAGEITTIKISLNDNNGRQSSASFKEKNQAIPKIVMGKKGNKLFINSIEN